MSKALEDYYPQCLDAAFLCHGPAWLQGLMRGLRPLLPQRFVEKIDFISPATNANERERLLRFVSRRDLPERFGGECATWPLPSARKVRL